MWYISEHWWMPGAWPCFADCWHSSPSSAEQAGDGRGSAEPHAVCGVPGLSARAHRPPAAAVRGRGQPGRETHEEEELQVGLTTEDKVSVHPGLGRSESCGGVNMQQYDSLGKTAIWMGHINVILSYSDILICTWVKKWGQWQIKLLRYLHLCKSFLINAMHIYFELWTMCLTTFQSV